MNPGSDVRELLQHQDLPIQRGRGRSRRRLKVVRLNTRFVLRIPAGKDTRECLWPQLLATRDFVVTAMDDRIQVDHEAAAFAMLLQLRSRSCDGCGETPATWVTMLRQCAYSAHSNSMGPDRL